MCSHVWSINLNTAHHHLQDPYQLDPSWYIDTTFNPPDFILVVSTWEFKNSPKHDCLYAKGH